LDEWNDEEFEFIDLAKEAFQQVFGKMSRSERQALLLSTIRILAIALLSWGCVANLCTSLTVTLSWTKANLAAAVLGCWNPLRSNALQREVFWTTYSYARLLLDPFYLFVQGAATLFLFGRYQRFVSNIEQKWITQAQRDKYYPLLYRVAALFLGFVSNLAVAGLVTLCGVGFGTIVDQWKLRIFG
jgi:ABC-type transport system involved in cytochrome bd biosynthesis fused ATPase/permease subunit